MQCTCHVSKGVPPFIIGINCAYILPVQSRVHACFVASPLPQKLQRYRLRYIIKICTYMREPNYNKINN